MRSLLVGLMLAAVACGPQMSPPDTAPRQAPIPEGRQRTAAPEPEEPAADTAMPATESGNMRVDHAWVKADTASEQVKRRKAIEAMRTKVVAGATFVVAWESLGEDGEVWHVAEGETYETAVIPEPARSMVIGQVSPVIPGDGGFHLFRILARD